MVNKRAVNRGRGSVQYSVRPGRGTARSAGI